MRVRISDAGYRVSRIDHYWTFDDWKLSAYLDVSNVYLNAPVVAVQYNENYMKRTDVTDIPI